MLQMFLDVKEKGVNKEDSKSLAGQFEKDAELKNVDAKFEEVMTDDAILQSATLFLVAGFDTTSNALSIISYHLATNLDLQERVREEVIKIV